MLLRHVNRIGKATRYINVNRISKRSMFGMNDNNHHQWYVFSGGAERINHLKAEQVKGGTSKTLLENLGLVEKDKPGYIIQWNQFPSFSHMLYSTGRWYKQRMRKRNALVKIDHVD